MPQDSWDQARRKMTTLHAATSTLDLSGLPGLSFEPLKYDRPGFYSIRVNLRYRLIFKFENGDAYAVGLENYHGRKTT